jgi:hypothetical protein
MTDHEFDICRVGGVSILWLDSGRIETSMEYLRESDVSSLGINAMRGFKLPSIDFIRHHPWVRKLNIVCPASGPYDLDPLYALGQLRSLYLSDPAPLDLSRFGDLESFTGAWHSKLKLDGCSSLRSLSLRGYKSPSGDLSTLPPLPALVELSLSSSPIRSLNGLSRYNSLKRLELHKLSKLESIGDATVLEGLEALDCSSCKRFQDHEAVRVLKRLRVLGFDACTEIPSLSFLDEMPCLERFGFVDTNVKDGDLRPLLRLKSVGFFAKKHYSHTPEEVDRAIEARSH